MIIITPKPKTISLSLDNEENIYKAFKYVLDLCPSEDAGCGMRNVYCGALIGKVDNIVQYYPNGEHKSITILGLEGDYIEVDQMPSSFVESILVKIVSDFKLELDTTIEIDCGCKLYFKDGAFSHDL